VIELNPDDKAGKIDSEYSMINVSAILGKYTGKTECECEISSPSLVSGQVEMTSTLLEQKWMACRLDWHPPHAESQKHTLLRDHARTKAENYTYPGRHTVLASFGAQFSGLVWWDIRPIHVTLPLRWGRTRSGSPIPDRSSIRGARLPVSSLWRATLNVS
jgi:hypothetical protein